MSGGDSGSPSADVVIQYNEEWQDAADTRAWIEAEGRFCEVMARDTGEHENRRV